MWHQEKKMKRIVNVDLLKYNGAAVSSSLAASVNYQPVWIGHLEHFAVQAAYTGTPNGTFKLQASNDPGLINSQSQPNQSSGVTHWTDVADSDIVVAAAGNFMVNFQNAGFEWIRLVWTAAGAGTTPALSMARVVGKGPA